MKICTKCKIEREENYFYTYKNGELRSSCKQCCSDYRSIKKYGFIKEKLQIPKDTKYCNKCGIFKNKSQFGKLKKSLDGLRYDCKECRNKNDNSRRNKYINICLCGCGEKCNKDFIAGHYCCGRKLSEEHKLKISTTSKKRICPDDVKIKISNSHKGKKHSEEWNKNNSDGHKGHEVTKKTREIISIKIKELWQNENFIRKLMSKSRVSPNKSEQKLLYILNNYFDYGYEFVGDGKVIIGGKCPDFINDKTKQIIELFGEYWHKKEEEIKRIEHFNNFGYETLIIWCEELKNEILLLDKLKKFMV